MEIASPENCKMSMHLNLCLKTTRESVIESINLTNLKDRKEIIFYLDSIKKKKKILLNMMESEEIFHMNSPYLKFKTQYKEKNILTNL